MSRISNVQIIPIVPKEGLVAFASFIFDECMYMGSVGICTKLGGGYRLTYPNRKVGEKDFQVFNPITKEIQQEIEAAVVGKYEDLMRNKKS